jgi:hypothetical protein
MSTIPDAATLWIAASVAPRRLDSLRIAHRLASMISLVTSGSGINKDEKPLEEPPRIKLSGTDWRHLRGGSWFHIQDIARTTERLPSVRSGLLYRFSSSEVWCVPLLRFFWILSGAVRAAQRVRACPNKPKCETWVCRNERLAGGGS